ncbi:hypothetical protein [Halomicronema hongdechloris]|nr:hypothetical protein [Halomicronema hongdechloris]
MSSRRPETQLFIVLAVLTLAVWVLRGLTILAFLPGIILWLLLLTSIATGIVSSWRSMH